MSPRNRSDVSFAKLTLPYPIFAADFDPYNRGYLVVGGGGGEGRSGVPNQISVLDVSSRAQITNAVDIELSRDEDSVQSLGSLATKDGLIVFAGINSSATEQELKRNEHFRSFEVTYPPRKKQKTEESDASEVKTQNGEQQVLGKRALFAPSAAIKKETYQRILRLSPSQRRDAASKRIGAIASGLAKPAQVIVFNATNPVPDQEDILTTIDLDDGLEAVDLDIAETDDSVFSVTYCTDYDLYEQTFKYSFSTRIVAKTPDGPRRVRQIPYPDVHRTPGSRPKFRSVRFLNSQNVLTLLNHSNKGGAEFQIYHLYPTGPAIQTETKKLPSHIKQAVSMDVCALGADKDGNQQFVIAASGQDISIEVFTTNYNARTETFDAFRKYLTIRDVHAHQMTKICFAPFHAPATSREGKTVDGPTQYIRLASVSYGNTVVVDTFPLQLLEANDKSKKTTAKEGRYVLSHPGDATFDLWTYAFIASILMLVLAFLIQSFGGGFGDDDNAGLFKFLPRRVRNFMDKPAAAAYGHDVEWATSSGSQSSASVSTSTSTSVETVSVKRASESITESPSSTVADYDPIAMATSMLKAGGVASSAPSVDDIPTIVPDPNAEPAERGRLQSVVSAHAPDQDHESTAAQKLDASPPSTKAILIRPDSTAGIAVDVHSDKDALLDHPEASAKHWHELEDHQKHTWKEKLKDAGHWLESEGESVLKGLLFSEYAGAVGGAVGDVLREL